MQYYVDFKFEINIFSLISLLTGIITGISLFLLIYVFYCMNSLKSEEFKTNKEINLSNDTNLNKIIKNYQEAFIDEKKRRRDVPYSFMISSMHEMMETIAATYYPQSSKPLLELSLTETLALNNYIISVIEKILNKKGLSLLKKFKLIQIKNFISVKNTITNTKIIKNYKKYHVSKIINFFTFIIGLLNPVTYVKRFIISPISKMLITKVFLLVYTFVGQETYAVYSKQALTNNSDIDDLNKLSLTNV